MISSHLSEVAEISPTVGDLGLIDPKIFASRQGCQKAPHGSESLRHIVPFYDPCRDRIFLWADFPGSSTAGLISVITAGIFAHQILSLLRTQLTPLAGSQV